MVYKGSPRIRISTIITGGAVLAVLATTYLAISRQSIHADSTTGSLAVSIKGTDITLNGSVAHFMVRHVDAKGTVVGQGDLSAGQPQLTINNLAPASDYWIGLTYLANPYEQTFSNIANPMPTLSNRVVTAGKTSSAIFPLRARTTGDMQIKAVMHPGFLLNGRVADYDVKDSTNQVIRSGSVVASSQLPGNGGAAIDTARYLPKGNNYSVTLKNIDPKYLLDGNGSPSASQANLGVIAGKTTTPTTYLMKGAYKASCASNCASMKINLTGNYPRSGGYREVAQFVLIAPDGYPLISHDPILLDSAVTSIDCSPTGYICSSLNPGAYKIRLKWLSDSFTLGSTAGNTPYRTVTLTAGQNVNVDYAVTMKPDVGDFDANISFKRGSAYKVGYYGEPGSVYGTVVVKDASGVEVGRDPVTYNDHLHVQFGNLKPGTYTAELLNLTPGVKLITTQWPAVKSFTVSGPADDPRKGNWEIELQGTIVLGASGGSGVTLPAKIADYSFMQFINGGSVPISSGTFTNTNPTATFSNLEVYDNYAYDTSNIDASLKAQDPHRNSLESRYGQTSYYSIIFDKAP